MSPDLNRDLSGNEGLRGHCLLSPFTRRFRLVFALLRGGSRINHHRARVLSLEGCPQCIPSSCPLPYRPRGFGVLMGLKKLSYSRLSGYLSLVHRYPDAQPKSVPAFVQICSTAFARYCGRSEELRGGIVDRGTKQYPTSSQATLVLFIACIQGG